MSMNAVTSHPRMYWTDRRPGLIRAGAGRGLPAWPVVALVGGYPLWWVLGLSPFVSVGFGAVLLSILLAHRHLRLFPGVLPLLAFASWCLVSVVMVDTTMRAVGFGIRWTAIVTAALVLVYVSNASVSLSDRTVLFALSSIWLLVVVGGYLGLIWPEGRFSTVAVHFLPDSMLNNDLVRDLFMPRFAEVQTPWGAPEPFKRPAAPFPYTNSWGGAIALLTPMVLALRTRLRSRWARFAVGLVMAASAVPAVATRNRGMFLILTVVLISYVFSCLWVRQRRAALRALLVGGAVGIVLAGFGAATLIAERQQYSNTTSGRASVYHATWSEFLRSPLIGFGAPRPSSELGVALGTQGAVWMYLFSYGLIGLGLFLIFLVGLVLRTARLREPWQIWLHSALVGALVASLFYGFDVVHLWCVMLPAALLLRVRYREPSPGLSGELDHEPSAAGQEVSDGDRPVTHGALSGPR